MSSLGRHVGACPSPQNCPFPWVIWTPSNTWFLGSTRLSIPNSISIGSAIFAQLMAECRYTLQWAASFPLKITSSHGGSGRHLTRFLGPILAHNPNGIVIGSAVFAQMTTVSLYFTMGHTFPLKIARPMGDLEPHLIHGSLSPPESSIKTSSRSVQPLLQGSLP